MSTTYNSPSGSNFVAEMLSQDFPTNGRPLKPHEGRSQKLARIYGFFARRGLI